MKVPVRIHLEKDEFIWAKREAKRRRVSLSHLYREMTLEKMKQKPEARS